MENDLAELANEVSLADELAATKEYREPSRTKSMEPVNYNESDFDSAPTKSNDLFLDEPEPPKRKMTVDETARASITMLDTACSLVLRPLTNRKYKNKISESDWNRIWEVEDKEIRELDEEDQDLLRRYERLKKELKEVKKKIPFGEDDYADLMAPMRLMVEKHNIDIPPGITLAFVCCKVVGSRIADCLMD